VAKLTLSFKDRKLKVFALQDGECVIGRDPDCEIAIDSLALEPRHARIRPVEDTFVIEPVSADCTVTVNAQPICEPTELVEGDSIQVGKHTLEYSAQPASTGTQQHATVTPLPTTAWLQIQSGVHMGRAIRLNKAFTRVGKPHGDLAVIAHRNEGYYLSTLQGEHGAQVNEQAIGELSQKLENGDQIAIGELQLQFFADGVAAQDSPLPPTGRSETRQRQFSRIPFEVSVTLEQDQHRWETRLLDISLHGALIETPANFEPVEGQPHQLTVHLEGGPDIRMDVEVAHKEGMQLGLRCAHIDVESITHLRRLVELNLGDPDLLERELSALG
jgi:predicted component of type VI protein secretion system